MQQEEVIENLNLVITEQRARITELTELFEGLNQTNELLGRAADTEHALVDVYRSLVSDAISHHSYDMNKVQERIQQLNEQIQRLQNDNTDLLKKNTFLLRENMEKGSRISTMEVEIATLTNQLDEYVSSDRDHLDF